MSSTIVSSDKNGGSNNASPPSSSDGLTSTMSYHAQPSNEPPPMSDGEMDGNNESEDSENGMQDEEIDDADSAGSDYSYEYQLSDDEDIAPVASIGVREGKAINPVAELDGILDKMNALKDTTGAGTSDENGRQKLDDLCLPLIVDLADFIKKGRGKDEGILLLALKMSPGFNCLLSSLLKNDSLIDWRGRGEIYCATLDLLELFCESDILVTMLQHNYDDGTSTYPPTYQSLLEAAKARMSEDDLAGYSKVVCQRIISTCDKVNVAIENYIDAGTIARVAQPEDENICDENNETQNIIRAPKPPSRQWTAFIKQVPRCAAAGGIRDSSVFREKLSQASPSPSPCLKKLLKELDGLNSNLPADPNCSIWVRFDEETPQFIRALVAAPLPGPTPYSGGLFAFDIYVPDCYPRSSPEVKLLTTGGGRISFGPNLYADGTVCLSLLGTWNGPKWDPCQSSLYQILISIQGMILGVEHPWYLEPGRGGWEKDGIVAKDHVSLRVTLYEDSLRVATAEFAMAQPLRRSLQIVSANATYELEVFREIVKAHFCENSDAVMEEVRNWLSDDTLRLRRSKAREEKISGTGPLEIDALQGLIPELEDLLSKVAARRYIDNSPSVEKKESSTTDMMDDEEDLKPPGKLLSCTEASSYNIPSSRQKVESKALADGASVSSESMESWEIIERHIDIADLSLSSKFRQFSGDIIESARSRFLTESPKLEPSNNNTRLVYENSAALGTGENVFEDSDSIDAMDIDSLPSAQIHGQSHDLGSNPENLTGQDKKSAARVRSNLDQIMVATATSEPRSENNQHNPSEQLNGATEFEPSEFRASAFRILKGLQSHEHGWVFACPIDPVMLGLPDYFDKIKKPMDLDTIEQKLTDGLYQSFVDFQLDVQLTFQNAKVYNGENSVVSNMAEDLKVKFEADLKKLGR